MDINTSQHAPVSTGMKVFLVAATVLQLGAIGAAHADLSHRDASLLNGSRVQWRMLSLAPAVGPLWYFLRGRR